MLSNLKPHSLPHLLLFMSAAPVFTCRVLSFQCSTSHLPLLRLRQMQKTLFPFILLSVNQMNSKFADLSSEAIAVLILSPLTCYIVYIVSNIYVSEGLARGYLSMK